MGVNEETRRSDAVGDEQGAIAARRKEQRIREILRGLECILTAHDSCAELVEVRDNTAVIYCGGPCMKCDNRCIESAVKEQLPDIEVVIQ